MEELKPEHAVLVFMALDKPVATDVLAKLDPECKKHVLAKLDSDKLRGLIKPLPPREAASVLAEVSTQQLHTFLNGNAADTSAAEDVQHRRNYPKGTAGRIMTTEFVRLNKGIRIADALEMVWQTDPNVDIPGDVYVIESEWPTRRKV